MAAITDPTTRTGLDLNPADSISKEETLNELVNQLALARLALISGDEGRISTFPESIIKLAAESAEASEKISHSELDEAVSMCSSVHEKERRRREFLIFCKRCIRERQYTTCETFINSCFDSFYLNTYNLQGLKKLLGQYRPDSESKIQTFNSLALCIQTHINAYRLEELDRRVPDRRCGGLR